MFFFLPRTLWHLCQNCVESLELLRNSEFFYRLLILSLLLSFGKSLDSLSFVDFSVILKKLDADVVIMLTNKLARSSVIILDISLGKELINWEMLLSVNLKWGVWLLFLSLRFSVNFNGLVPGFLYWSYSYCFFMPLILMFELSSLKWST